MIYKYKKGLKIELEDGTEINIYKNSHGYYQVYGQYGISHLSRMLQKFYSPQYLSVAECGKYLQTNFKICLLCSQKHRGLV